LICECKCINDFENYKKKYIKSQKVVIAAGFLIILIFTFDSDEKSIDEIEFLQSQQWQQRISILNRNMPTNLISF